MAKINGHVANDLGRGHPILATTGWPRSCVATLHSRVAWVRNCVARVGRWPWPLPNSRKGRS